MPQTTSSQPHVDQPTLRRRRDQRGEVHLARRPRRELDAQPVNGQLQHLQHR